MAKYLAPSAVPIDPEAFRAWVKDEMRHLSDALSELETDTITLQEFNAEPSKLYNGLVVYADGTNWDPGSGRGVYVYASGAWALLG